MVMSGLLGILWLGRLADLWGEFRLAGNVLACQWSDDCPSSSIIQVASNSQPSLKVPPTIDGVFVQVNSTTCAA